MAAQEYYGTSMPILQGPPSGPFPLPQQNGMHPPRPQNQQQPPQAPRPNTSNGQAPPYPLNDTPPPAYSAFNQQQPPQRASSQPPPQNYQPYRPSVDTHQYPPEKLSVPPRPSTLQNMSRPSDYAAQYPPPNAQYQPPPVQPPNGMYQQVGPGLGSLSQVYGSQHPPRRSSTSGASPYRRDSRSRSRSRSRDGRDHKHRHHHHNSRPQAQRQKSSGVNTFLGAGGGAIVGDLIFPGLGTLGGALLGGVGGHEYGKKRTQSNPSRGQRRKGETYEEEYRRGRK